MTDDAGDVNIRAVEDLPRKGRPKVRLLTIPEPLILYQPAVCDKLQSPVLLLATEYVDKTQWVGGQYEDYDSKQLRRLHEEKSICTPAADPSRCHQRSRPWESGIGSQKM